MDERTYMPVLLMVLFVALLATAFAPALADTGRGRHKRLYVVPTPGEVTIDGKLEDWDLSGQIEMFVVEATRSTQSAKIAAMHDENALYLSGVVNDPNPMMNRHDPKVDPDRGWDADACQFRIVVDPEADYPVKESKFKYGRKNPPEDTRDDIVHLLMWHYTDEATANLQMHLGMSYRVPREAWEPHGLVPYDKFDGKYRKWEDGTGYTFEYRIPWDTLGAKRPLKGGDAVAGTVQINWSRPDGLKTAGGSAWAYDVMRKPGFTFQSADCWGKLIFREEGNVPQELVNEGVPPERNLPLEFTYKLPGDGETTIQIFDQDGQSRRILVAQKERFGGVNTERWDGMNDYGEVEEHAELLPAGEYEWRGIFNENNLRAKYRFSVHNSGNPPYPTDDNTGGWGGDHGAPQTATALEDGMLLAWSGSEYGWGLIRTDTDGRKQWGCNKNAAYMTTDGERIYIAGAHGFDPEAGVRLLDVGDSRPTRFDNGVAYLAPPPGGERETNHVTGLEYDDRIIYVAYAGRNLIALFNGKTGAVRDTWKVPTPGRLAARPDGRMAVVSGDRILSVKDGKVRTWISNHLDEPVSVAVGDDGTAYVANRGDRQNVSVFGADGAYERSIGTEGGRPAVGTYDPSGMYQPGGIDLDARGRLWVAETTGSPKRISVWNTGTGENVEELFGGSSYFAYGYIDPDRPTEIYGHNVLWEIDWDDYSTRPKATIWRANEPNMAPAPNPDAHSSGGGFRILTAEKGRQFGWGGAGRSRRKVIYIREGNVFRPFAGVINPWREGDGFPALEDYMAKLNQDWDERRVAGHRRPKNLFWQDANGDGKVAPGEVTPIKEVGTPVWMNQDLSLLLSSGHTLRPAKVTEAGQPVYDIAQAEETPWVGKSLFRGLAPYLQDEEGAVYTLRHRDGPSLIKWSPEGEMVWNYPDLIRWHHALNLPTVGPGRLWGMTRPMGLAGEYFAHQTYFGINHIFRTDGMYIGAVLKPGRLSGRGPYKGQPEGQGGAFVKLNIDGEDRYFIIHGGQDVRVWEVLGLESIQDLAGGTYVHTEQKVAKARSAYQEYLAAKRGAQDLKIVRGRDALEEARPVGRELEGGRGFQANVAYDDSNLYARFDVQSPHGLVNGQPDPKIMFRGGNCLDIQLATNPDADPEREEPAPGDLRLLVTRQDGESLAVLYEPKVAGFDGEPTVFDSPTGEEPFDRIRIVDVGLDYEKTDGGFTATVTVPLDLLGLKLKAGRDLKYDLGYVFGNARGTRTAVRAYVHNNSFTANVVDDIPHESRLEPGEWGKAEVE